MQLAGSTDGGWVYTQGQPAVQWRSSARGRSDPAQLSKTDPGGLELRAGREVTAESHVPEDELLRTREQGERVRRRAGEYPPARLLLPGGLTHSAEEIGHRQQRRYRGECD
jgi:hypothetical protein